MSVMVSLCVVLGSPAVQVQLKKHPHLPLPPVIHAQSVDDLAQLLATVQVYQKSDPNNNNNVHLSCAHQRHERSHDTH